jgi:arylsulfatase A-like enzyme
MHSRSRLVRASFALALAGPAVVAGGRSAPSSPSRPHPPNVLVILIDQLRADRLGLAGSTLALTPRMDEIGRGGFYFSRARSAAPWTYPSVCTLLTGLYPAAHGADRIPDADGSKPWLVPLAPEVTTLAEYLQAAGYDTGAYVTNPYLKPESRTDQGFARFHHDFVKSWTTNRDDWWQQSSYADTVNVEVLEWLESRPAERPFFAYVHYIDVHGPWTWAPFLTPQERAVIGQKVDDRPDVYNRAVRFVDEHVGALVGRLRARYPDLVVIITSDHGTTLEDVDRVDPLKLRKASLHDFNLRVPLIVWGRGVRGLSEADVSLVDVLPTVLDLAGLKPHPSAVLHGESLAPIMRGGGDRRPAIFAEVDDSAKDSRARAMVASGEKLIEVERPRRARLLYDLTRDPSEMANLETLPVGQRQSEFARMGAAFGRLHSQRRAAPPVLLSPETIERLRALGYIK